MFLLRQIGLLGSFISHESRLSPSLKASLWIMAKCIFIFVFSVTDLWPVTASRRAVFSSLVVFISVWFYKWLKSKRPLSITKPNQLHGTSKEVIVALNWK